MNNIFQPTDCLSLEELQRYSKGDVSGALRHKIENHLIDCPLCQEAAEGYESMSGDSEEVLTDIYQEIDARTAAKTATLKRRNLPWNSIAAGLLFLLSVGAAYLYYQKGVSASNYQAYFENQDQGFAVRAIEENKLPVDMANGLKLYREKNFQGSLSFFEDYIKINPESVEATYYAAMSALNVGEKGTAIDLMTTVRMNADNLYEEATWVLAGLYLDRGDQATAKKYLEDLVKVENGFYTQSAKELLAKLE